MWRRSHSRRTVATSGSGRMNSLTPVSSRPGRSVAFFRLPAGGRSLVRSVLLAGARPVLGPAQTVTTLVSENFDTPVNAGTGLRDATGKYSTGGTASTWWFIQTGGSLSTA